MKHTEHPYLFFSKKDVPTLIKRFEREPFRTRWQLMIEDAEAILTLGRPEQNFDRMSYRYCATTAFVYAMTGEKKYARRAIAEMLANFKLDLKTEWQFNSVNCEGAGLGTSNFSLACGLVYDWCYDALTEEERAIFKDGFENIVNDLYLKSLHHANDPESSDWWVFRDHSNWCGVCHAAQGVAGLAFYHDSAGARRAVRYASEHIPRFIRENMDIDGGAAEGVMYARYGIEYAIKYLVAACRCFGLDRAMRDNFKMFNDKLAGYWDIYMLTPDNGYANFGNVGEQTMKAYWHPDDRGKEGPNSVLHAFFDAILPDGDPLLRWASDVGGSWYVFRGASPFYLLWRKDEAPPCVPFGAPPPMTLQDAVLFRETGQVVFRSGRLWIAFNGGVVSPDSHFNRDLGSFIMLYDGDRFTSDPGYGDVETWQHSTLLVNQLGQLKHGRGRYLAFDKGDGFYYLACELADAYDPASGLQTFIRHIAVIDDEYVIIMDEVAAAAPADFEWNLQTRKPLSQNGTTAVLTGKDAKQMYIVQAETGQPIVAHISNWKKKQDRHIAEMTTLHIKPASPVASHIFVTLFYPCDGEMPTPTITFDRQTGEIIVCGKDGKTDSIKFGAAPYNLYLETVNGKKLSGLLNPTDRSVVPFRDVSHHEVDTTKMPSWILGTYTDMR